jgi:hypothetical protein
MNTAPVILTSLTTCLFRLQSCRTTRFANGCIAAGGYHSAVLDEDGQLWTFGLGQLGQLGHGPGMRLLDSKTKLMTHDEYDPRSINGFFPEYRATQVRSERPRVEGLAGVERIGFRHLYATLRVTYALVTD